jgi:hypothetical protein
MCWCVTCCCAIPSLCPVQLFLYLPSALYSYCYTFPLPCTVIAIPSLCPVQLLPYLPAATLLLAETQFVFCEVCISVCLCSPFVTNQKFSIGWFFFQTAENQNLLCRQGTVPALAALLCSPHYKVQMPSLRCLANMCFQNQKVSAVVATSRYSSSSFCILCVF